MPKAVAAEVAQNVARALRDRAASGTAEASAEARLASLKLLGVDAEAVG